MSLPPGTLASWRGLRKGTPVRNMMIRPAKVADLAALCQLYRQLNPDDPPWPSEAAALDLLARVLAQAGTTILCWRSGR